MSHTNIHRKQREKVCTSKIITSSFMQLRSFIGVCSDYENRIQQQNIRQELNEKFAKYGIVRTFEVCMDWKNINQLDVEEIRGNVLTLDTLQTLAQKTNTRTHKSIIFHPHTLKMEWKGEMKFKDVVSAVFQNNDKYYALKLPTSNKEYFCDHVLKMPLSNVKMKKCTNFQSGKDDAIYDVEAAKLNKHNMTISAENLTTILKQHSFEKGTKFYLRCENQHYSLQQNSNSDIQGLGNDDHDIIFYADIQALANDIHDIIKKETKNTSGFLDNALDCSKGHGKIRRILAFGVFLDHSSTTSKTTLCKVFYQCKDLCNLLKPALGLSLKREPSLQRESGG